MQQVSSFNVSEFDDSGIQFSTDDFIPSTAFDSLNSFVDSGFNQIDYDGELAQSGLKNEAG